MSPRNGPNLASIDLNLLVAFEALLAERNVSRAGERVGRAQSSMSDALARLRALFGDELFVRTPRGMRPTECALKLAQPINEALRQVRTALALDARFTPETDGDLFRIGAGDHADFALGVPLVALLRKCAPNTTTMAITVDQAAALQMLDDDELDLVVAAFQDWPKRIRSVALYRERFVCAARSGHPAFAGRAPLLDEFLALPHVRVSVPGGRSLFDSALAAMELNRRVAITIPNFAVLSFVLERSDLVAVIGERVALQLAARSSIAVHPIPVAVGPVTMRMYWTAHADADPAVTWLRGQLQEIGAMLDAGTLAGTLEGGEAATA